MITKEIAEEIKKACAEQDCETCPFSVGIYMEGLDYVYYSCDLRKKPREWDIEKERMKQSKASKKAAEKAEREKEKNKKAAEREAKKKAIEEEEKKLKEQKKKKKLANKVEASKKKRGRPKKVKEA